MIFILHNIIVYWVCMNSLLWEVLGVEGNLNNIILDIFVCMYTDYTLNMDRFALNVDLEDFWKWMMQRNLNMLLT